MSRKRQREVDVASELRAALIHARADDTTVPVSIEVIEKCLRQRDFIEFLLAPQTQALFQEYGFDRVTGDVGLVQRQEVKP